MSRLRDQRGDLHDGVDHRPGRTLHHVCSYLVCVNEHFRIRSHPFGDPEPGRAEGLLARPLAARTRRLIDCLPPQRPF